MREVYDSNEWKVTIAARGDFDRWMDFVRKVQDVFHGIDLYNDKKHRMAVMKNIKRATAVYVQNDSDTDILGAMLYSPSSRHIGWLAVHPNHRRTGIGTALANYLIRELGVSEPILVKTFLESDEPGESAHRFYNSLGFEQECIVDDKDGRNAGHPFHLLIKKECL